MGPLSASLRSISPKSFYRWKGSRTGATFRWGRGRGSKGSPGQGRHRAVEYPELLPHLDVGKPIVVLAGVHGGCYQLFGGERVRAVRDLKGKTAAIHYFGSGDHVLLSTMLSYVGIDPRHEVNWMTGRDLRNAMDLFAEGKADAFVGYAQEPARSCA